MKLLIAAELLARVHAHGASAYPDEGAGFLIGRLEGSTRRVLDVLPVDNEREGDERRRRYLIGPHEMLRAENEAARRGLDLLGVFHSHPDHPSQPSETDRQWALPWLSYLITRVENGAAQDSRSWRLNDDRSAFEEETLEETEAKE
jgi:proteasome lid subunit RPN8/RPN11